MDAVALPALRSLALFQNGRGLAYRSQRNMPAMWLARPLCVDVMMETYTVWTLLSAGLRIVVLVLVILWVGPVTSYIIYLARKRIKLKKARKVITRRLESL